MESVVFAKGAPLTEAHLPGTLTVLRLEYLARLMPSGLSVENYANVVTFIFSECPNLDWQAMLERCTNVQHIRVTGIDMEGDGALLDKYMAVGGVDVDGNYTDTCGLVGAYRLTKYVEDDIYNAYVSHYPELNVTLPQYSMIYSDDDVADDKNYTNPDNKTGYDYGNDYVPNGHVAKILSTRCGCLGKQVSDGEMTICRLNPEDFNYYGDGTSLNNSTSAKLNGDEGDAFIYEPRYWYKGINDILGAFSNGVSRKYSCYSSNENMPNMPKHKRVTFDELNGLGFVTKGYKVNVGFSVVSDAIISDSSYTLIKVDVEGYKVVRYPTITNIATGSCFSDNDGNVLSSSNVADEEKFIDGMYVLNKIPSQAKFLYFTINNKAFWDDVILSRSDKVEDMEPDWVEHVPCLTGMFESVFYQQSIHSIAVGINAVSLSKEEHELYAAKRNLQLIDYEMHKDVANLFFAKYGRRDSQNQCGRGSDNSKIAGNSAFMGMTDTFNKNGGLNDPFNPNTNEKALHVRCLGYEGWFGYNDEIMVGFANKLDEEQSIHITSYNGEVRKVRKTQNSSIVKFYQKHIHHQKYMDLFLHRRTASGSGSTFYCDGFELIQKEIDYVYRGKDKGDSYGYGPGVSAIGVWNIYNAASRIAFRGVIKEAASVSAYKELEAKY